MRIQIRFCEVNSGSISKQKRIFIPIYCHHVGQPISGQLSRAHKEREPEVQPQNMENGLASP